MKYIRLLLFVLLLVPGVVRAASNDFMIAAQLLSAAKNADIQQVQILINSGANVNYTDSTGLSIVCTALMNNDIRAAQILQMYGADASKCDQQIKSYNNRTKPKGSGGLFGGLSSAQTLTLAAAGAAVVVGGLFLLTDVFDPGNSNNNSAGGGNRPNGGTSGGGTTPAKDAFTLYYGPAMPNATSEKNYGARLDYFSTATTESSLLKDSFNLMNDKGQNYLLMMYGYSPLARGYLGMRTLRYLNEPVLQLGAYKGESVIGGRPVDVALVTANGINSALKPAGVLSAEKNSLDDVLLLWTAIGNPTTGKLDDANRNTISSKYYNNVIETPEKSSWLFSDLYTVEDSEILQLMDLGGFGTAIQNPLATDLDNILAKIVGGRDTGYADADYFGFMPNGQMMIFRTGNGQAMKTVTDETTGIADDMRTGSFTSIKTDENLNLLGRTLKLTVDGNAFTATDGTDTYTGYIGVNGMLYIDSQTDGILAYTMSSTDTGGTLTLAQKSGNADYYNYRALLTAAGLKTDGPTNGRSHPDVLANAAVIAPLYEVDAKTIYDVWAVADGNYKSSILTSVDDYYNRDTSDDVTSLPSSDASAFFKAVGITVEPLVIFSTGGFKTNKDYDNSVKLATFENAAPLAYSNLEHLFMSVVAVGQAYTGTYGTTSVSGYSPENKYALSRWRDNNGTPDDASDDIYYQSRVCGVAGTGTSSVDPWCFAAAGVNAEMAVASAAGAAGVLKSAFDYLDNRQVFALLALTADGPYLATIDGNAISQDYLYEYLQSRYILPNEYDKQWQEQGRDYLDIFKEVFGYGLINLDRATTPGTKVYYYSGVADDIKIADGNAYWRAATNTTFRTSSAFRPRAATISAPFFDVLESANGDLRLPRVWQNEFALGDVSRRGLYMGDVLGELTTRSDGASRTKVGNLGFSIARSERAYYDNLNGLDALHFDYSHDNWNVGAAYQRYLTDGASRFAATSNPVLALASNAVVSDAEYGLGRWAFGGRVFSGNITDEGLLENDPTITSQFMPARLGAIRGAQSHMSWRGDVIGFTTTVGRAYESDTILGAQTGGLLDLGGGNTTYIDTVVQVSPMDNLNFSVRGTVARTTATANGDFIMGISNVYSDAVSVGMDWGKLSVSVARPLAVTRGALRYAYADYQVVQIADGQYDLNIRDMRPMDITLRPENRELRFTGTLRHDFGNWTSGAAGFIYRVHPDNCDDFGNETIFMLKMSHRLGI